MGYVRGYGVGVGFAVRRRAREKRLVGEPRRALRGLFHLITRPDQHYYTLTNFLLIEFLLPEQGWDNPRRAFRGVL